MEPLIHSKGPGPSDHAGQTASSVERPGPQPKIRLSNLVKRFREALAVDGVTLEVADGELVTLLGPSGCGKTTTLRMVAGLVQPTSGSITIDGKDVSRVPAHQRNLGFVFQHSTLFPHMTVANNVAYGLRIRKVPRQEIGKRVAAVLELVGCSGLESRYSTQLSGGQQQRVALARALVVEPKVLLLDEPFGALDRALREQMQVELKELQRKLRMTTVFVTHDQGEAMTLSDRVCVMRFGKIEQLGAPRDIYEHPATDFVMRFVGESNVFPGIVQAVDDRGVDVRVAGDLVLRATRPAWAVEPGRAVHLSVRPERVRIDAGVAQGTNALQGRVRDLTYLGSLINMRVDVPGGHVLKLRMENSMGSETSIARPGSDVTMAWPWDATLVLPGEA